MKTDVRGWVAESLSDARSGNQSLPARLMRPLYLLYEACFLTVTHRFPYGTNVFDRDWDALIVLDACRVDALEAVVDEYDFLDSVGSITSVGSTSFEWMNNTFRTKYRSEIAGTAYLTQNQFSAQILGRGGTTGTARIPFAPSDFDVVDPDDFAYVEDLWQAGFDDSSEWIVSSEVVSRVAPRYTTERAITAGRTLDVERLIIHYMYPHDPYVLADAKLQPRFDAALKNGTASREEVWEAYLENLRFVLDDVEVLLENLDADKVVITADHGEAFGEYMFYRHPPACPIPCVRKVPWVETTAVDGRSLEPTAPDPASTERRASVEDRLEELGYL